MLAVDCSSSRKRASFPLSSVWMVGSFDPASPLVTITDITSHPARTHRAKPAPKIDINKVRDYKNRVVEKLTSGTGQVAK